jgi:hypothetical protein
MTWELSEEEKQGVYAAPDEKRYSYFVGHVADWGEAWALKSGESWASLTDGGKRYFPVWPHPAFAEENLEGEWADNEIAPITVDSFLDWLGTLAEMGDGVAMFRRKEGDFITVPPEPLKADLQAALDEIR